MFNGIAMIFVGNIWDEKQVVDSYSYYYSIALNDINSVFIPMTWILIDTIDCIYVQAHSRCSYCMNASILYACIAILQSGPMVVGVPPREASDRLVIFQVNF